ncbi:MAG TPA: DUF4124 domain-containing protein [Noviherbaspirillum sp.]|uniref:DUF4124 domain-containing protein n=1 Tax=Noviherbaspirillum sp. TaxID=1926288 RepID=UPI002B4A22D8|nr:DUF4124 domain-containing protein [Noviherbaspirillum sp.]HJV87298.1 DUF4124 domain-containing protein [Noviherbaspirillum sp.]
MKSSSKIAGALALLVIPWMASAQIYQCKDASGRTLTSDRPIAECADRVMRELDSKGLVRREILPPPIAEQKQQLRAQEAQRKADEAAAEEQRRNDMAIRARYRSESDVELARKRAIEPVEEQIKREKLLLANAEKHQQLARSEVDTTRKKNATVPTVMQRKLDDAEQAVSTSRKLLLDREAEVVQINAKFDATLKRYRELVGEVAAK